MYIYWSYGKTLQFEYGSAAGSAYNRIDVRLRPGTDDPGVDRLLLERELWPDLSEPQEIGGRGVRDLKDRTVKGQAGPAHLLNHKEGPRAVGEVAGGSASTRDSPQ